MATGPCLLEWLLDSDPALRWQVQRVIAGALPGTWETKRAQGATAGYGAQLPSKQDADGQWAGGAYVPVGFSDSPEADQPGQSWTVTTSVLKDLRELGLNAVRGMIAYE